MKRVVVQLKDHSTEEYQNVLRVEEDKHNEQVIAVRLYDSDGELLAIIDRDQIAKLKVSDDPTAL